MGFVVSVTFFESSLQLTSEFIFSTTIRFELRLASSVLLHPATVRFGTS